MEFMPQSLREHFRQKKAKLLDMNNLVSAAITVPFIERDNELYLVFQIRSQHVSQPGEICFPGGKVEDGDASLEETAVRELTEELGIEENNVTIMGELDYIVTPFRLIVYPFSGIISSEATFQVSKKEVEDIIIAPVSELLVLPREEHHIRLNLKPDNDFPYHLIPGGENYKWRKSYVTEHFYNYNGHIIWGLTARILTHVLNEIKEANT
ncbi:CoA pyrophosphatase [Salipaludibacillus agaradhaerens]|uniref:CoA pyrophosphatase n=1 Tax=Salipaludibacillus agaradhaerens TaxID=76935 RepID=A0A9Q4B252_SALAG|nr:CoA pyrophosphatase [Salipaludibacillus agaradhaerens]MCR6096937.1 CoA pyrophosphatase [Salipaludibacillus agaradhaerens]MCR6113578.1 CoA pyrophosphatase [Salipaludibacillus agaradhaerens]